MDAIPDETPAECRWENLIVRRYRLFIVDPARRIREEIKFEASNDAGAKLHATELRAGRHAELWTTHSRIARWSYLPSSDTVPECK